MAEYRPQHAQHIRYGDDGVTVISESSVDHQQYNIQQPQQQQQRRQPKQPQQSADKYVNFNQFVMQHNLALPPMPPMPTLPTLPPQQLSANAGNFMPAVNAYFAPPAAMVPYADFGAAGYEQYPTTAATTQQQRYNLEDMVRNSNLMATASEFVPQNYSPKPVDLPVVNTALAAKTPAAVVAEATIAATEASSSLSSTAAAAAAAPYEAQIVAQAAAVQLSPSQGAIRKTYSNGNNNNNHNHQQLNNGNNNRGQMQRGGRGQRQSNGGWQPDDRNEESTRSSSNWREQAARPVRNGGGGGHSASSTIGGSGRTQSQYSDDRSYGKEYGQSYEKQATQQQATQQQPQQQNYRGNAAATGRNAGGAGGGDDDQQQNQRNGNGRNQRAANPFSRNSRSAGVNSESSQYAQQQHNARASSDAYTKPHAHNNNSHHHHRSQDVRENARGGGAAGGFEPPPPTTETGPSKFDKKKHPEFKPNRNLKANEIAAAAVAADDRRTGECSQREKLIREIDAGRLECLVCCESIKPFQSTWCCANCFHIIHLSCIIKWANSSKDEAGWRCPACQHVTKTTPDAYLCFCGKTRNPQYNRNDVAHSCGELCGKHDGCEHACTLLCHPGPCATCHAQVTRECGCGRTRRTMQCCQKEDVQCTEVCDKVLACGVHRCERACHAGECDGCAEELEHRCHCGKDKRLVVCDAANNAATRYSCKKLCNRQLACKAHKCKRVCHEDECGECQLLPEVVTACPCGRQRVEAGARKACTDAVPLCEALCERVLKCGQPSAPHRCASRCHVGGCPPCDRETAVRCRCGHMEQMVKCRTLQTRSDDARCKKRCVKKRNCGKHKCNQECCIDIDHVCPLPCTFTLSCGKHKCDQTCHKGRCQRCYRSSFVELYCECGAQVIYPPVACGSKRPVCDRPCGRAHGCDHPVQHNCHAAAQCPPCMAFVSIRCYGGHEERKTIPCSQGEFSCGLKCGKALRCGRHRCVRTCHAGECEKEAEVCKQVCTKLRVMCGHRCLAACHEGGCPDTACREQVEVLCQCGHRKAMRTCQEFANEYRRIASSKFATTMESMQQGGGMVELSDVLGPIKMSNNKTLDCNDECKTLERNRRLALGLQIRNPDTAAKYAPKYTEFAKGWARKDPQLVGMIHDKLTELVKLAKQSQQKSRSHSFPTMNWEKRQLVHEMCQTFGIESVAYDAEPHRNVVASATRDTSWLPSLSLLEVLKRESGQRRIPVPMNNAWGVKR